MIDRRPQVARGTSGMVTTGHAYATDAALDVLRAGGNAVDAAVCAALVLCVVLPYATSLGGELYALVYEPATRSVQGLNGTGASPAGLDPAVFADGVPRNGPRSSTVPALLRGLGDLLARYGTRPFAPLIAPARQLADDGFPVFPVLAENVAERRELLAGNAAAAARFLPGGEPLARGATLRQPDLGAVLATLAADGIDAFYEGPLAAQFAAATAAAGGDLTREDLAAHRSLWQTPLRAPFAGHDVWTMPPNSYGMTLALQLLELAEREIASIDPNEAAFVELGYAARQRAYATAAPWIADPRIGEAPARAFLDAAVARGAYASSPAAPVEPRDRCTTNVCVIDAHGMAVSLVESVSAPFGAGVVLDGLGIVLNNRIAGFSADPAHPNAFAPAKRPANTLAPALVTRDGALVASVGTPGTVGQTCTLAQLLARVYARGEAWPDAIAAPRWSVDFSGGLIVENSMAEPLRAAVAARRPEVKTMRAGWISFGSLKVAAVTADGLLGVADFRRAATTAGL
jgi:gamma-glutamyltranspeptidase/glutathione hydrolase